MVLIVAADRNWGIGKDGDQPVHLPEDLQRFRDLTLGRTVILGRRTLEALPGGRPLPGRRSLVLSRNPRLAPPGARVCRSLEELLQAAPEDARVIGGESVYRLLLPWCTLAYVTRLEAAFPADRFCPDLDADPAWEVSERSETRTDRDRTHGEVRFCYVTYRRIRPG